MKASYFLVTAMAALTLLTGCKANEYAIKDLLHLAQKPSEYVSEEEANTPHIPRHHHKMIEAKYRAKFVGPWGAKPSVKKKHIQRDFNSFKNKGGYGENKQKINPEWFSKIEKNMSIHSFPNYKKNAITIANTNLRLLPTKKPYFSEFTDSSKGFPFDTIQNSTLAANTPILITHITRDNAWVFVETPNANGWVPIRDIAYAGPKFIRYFKKHKRYVAAIDEDFPVKTLGGTYLYQGNIGMVFPLMKESKTHYHIVSALANSKRYAYAKQSVIAKKYATRKPLPLTIANISKLCNKLVGQSYGWGGLYNNRDCSAMIQDIFAPFGIWLPRNSRSQAKKGGLFFDLDHFTETEKEAFILDNAIPYLTLLWFPGHIMLYIGEQEGDPLVFHNLWGIKTNTKEKRKIVGKSVITTLRPGEELAKVAPDSNFLRRIAGMTLLVPRYN